MVAIASGAHAAGALGASQTPEFAAPVAGSAPGLVFDLASTTLGPGAPAIISVHLNDDAVALNTPAPGGVVTPGPLTPAADQPRGVVAFDADNDGDTDLLTIHTATGRVSLLRNDAPTPNDPPQFVIASVLPVAQTPVAAAALDWNRDGLTDLAIADQTGPAGGAGGAGGGGGSGQIVLLRNTGVSFAFGPRLTGFNAPADVAAVDVDADGLDDLVIADFGGQRLVVLAADTLSFDAADPLPRRTDLATPGRPNALAIADVDLDGRPDLAATLGNTGLMALAINETVGSGPSDPPAFAPPLGLALGIGPVEAHAADLNADGAPDLVALLPSTRQVAILTNGLTEPWTLTRLTLPVTPGRLAIADVAQAESNAGATPPELIIADQSSPAVRTLVNVTPIESVPCPGDANGDLYVDVLDLNVLLSRFNAPAEGDNDPADFNNDGLINVLDLNRLLSNWGAVCGET